MSILSGIALLISGLQMAVLSSLRRATRFRAFIMVITISAHQLEMLVPKIDSLLLRTEEGRKVGSSVPPTAKAAVGESYGMANTWSRILDIVEE